MKNKLKAELKELANQILQNDYETSASALKEEARKLYEKLTVLAFTEENLAGTSETTFGNEEVKTEMNQVPEPQLTEFTGAEVRQEAELQEEPIAENQQAQEPEMGETTAAGEQQELENEDQEPQTEVNQEKKEEKAVQKNATVLQNQSNPSPTYEKDDYLPDGTEYNDSEAITEPNTEKIKDIVAQMPPETQKLDFMMDNLFSRKDSLKTPEKPVGEPKKDFRDIGVDYDNLPNFEPVKKQEKERPRSLNDRLKKGFNVGLNDRLAFIRHLFEGNTADYNRVVSQLNTFDSKEEAIKFVQLVVKPDYKNWQGKEEFETKFMELVENKF